MSVTFAEKLARIPGYQAGVPTGQAPEAIAGGGIAQLASNESPFPPHPKVVEAIARAAGAMNRYPDPDATLLRRRIAERYETEPGRIAVGNGSCEILLAAAEALCEPGAEILYAWPSFSMYPYLPALTGAREIRVPLAEGDVHDLDAMAAEVTAATQLLLVCNPNNPTATHIPAAEIAAFCERVPAHVTVDPRRGLRRVPDPRRPRRHASTCSPTSPTWSSCAPSASATAWPGCGSATRSARPSSAPRSTRCASRSASTRSPRRRAPRRSCTTTTSSRRVEATIVERVRVEAALAELGLAHRREPGQLLLDRPRRRRRGGGRRRPRRARDRGPPGHAARRPRPPARHLRHRRRRTSASSRRWRDPRLIALALCYKLCSEANGRHHEQPLRLGAALAAPLRVLLAI